MSWKGGGGRSLSQDRILAQRLEALLPTLEEGVDVDDICSVLRDRHAEYRRHKGVSFKQLVIRALEAVRRKHPELFAEDNDEVRRVAWNDCTLREELQVMHPPSSRELFHHFSQ